MLKLWLIRHGMTEGNKLGRYIGVTDEPLCQEGIAFLKKLTYPEPEDLYVSPMTRCRETAQILFPNQKMHIIEELAECDFGAFENKNYMELEGNREYQEWIDSNGTLPFPAGESRQEFCRRTMSGFHKAVTGCIRNHISYGALVIHGGTIMNIMDMYTQDTREYYQWHVKNGGGYLVEIDTELWKADRYEITLCESLMEG